MSWVQSLDSWLSIAANSIAVLTFIFTRNVVTSWATSLRRDAGSVRYVELGAPPPRSVVIPHAQIQMEERVGPGPRDWRITWSDANGDPRQAVAQLISPRLRWHVRFRQKRKTHFAIVGEVRYLQKADGTPTYVEVTALDFICDDLFSRWVIAPLAASNFGGFAKKD